MRKNESNIYPQKYLFRGVQKLGINEIIIYIMVAFMALGAIDKCIGNKFGLGEQFEEGFMAMGSLTIATAGVSSFSTSTC